ncbi:MAG: PAS domain S-box protein [Flavobacteriales bacterium]
MSDAKPIAPTTAAGREAKRALEQLVYHAVMEFSPWPMAEVEGAGHVVQAINPAFCALLEKTQEEVLGKPLSQLFVDDHATQALMERVLATGEAATHVETANNTSGPIYWSYTCWPVQAKDQLHVGLMIQVTETSKGDQQTKDMNEALLISAVQQHELTDVADRLNVKLLKEMAERARAEKLLQQNHDTFSNLIENAPFGVFVIDGQFRFRQVSAASAKVFRNVGQLIDRDYAEVLRIIWPEPLASEVVGHFRHTLATGSPYVQKDTTEQRLDIDEVESYDWRIERIILPDGQFGVVCYFYDISEIKRAEEELRTSEEFNRSITDNSPDCIKILDLDGNLLSMAERGQKLLCIPDIAPYLNTPWKEFYEGEDARAAAAAAVEAAAQGGEGNFVGFFHTVQGEPKWWDVRITPIRDAGGTINRLLAVSRDVTELKQTELNLAFLASISGDLLRLSDMDEMMAVVSEKIGIYLGLSACAFVEIREGGDQALVTHDWHREQGMSFVGIHRMEDFFTPEFQAASHAGETFVVSDTATDPRAIASNIAALNIGAVINVPLLQDGIWRFTLGVYHSEPYPWRPDEVELTHEFTKRIWARMESLRAETMVREMDARLKLALDAAQMGTWSLDPATGFFNVDERFQSIFGTTASSLNLEQGSDSVHPDDRDRVAQVVQAAMQPDGKAHVEVEFRIVHPDASVHWVLSNGRTVFDDATPVGSLTGFAGTVADITERKELEQTLEQTAKALAEADRRKSEFLATLAHELRNPLAPLRNGLELLTMVTDDRGTWDQTHGMMTRQVDQMVRLIDELMDLSRITRGVVDLRLEEVDLRLLLEQALENSRSLMVRMGHTVVRDIGDQPLLVEGDGLRLTQVFSNLLNNAAKYTDGGGVITVRAGSSEGDALITVEDNGIGIAKEQLEKVFEMFSQVDRGNARAQGGLGIGLNIVKHLVEDHGGSVEVRSAGAGKGSSFTVRIPLAAPHGPEIAEPAKSGSTASGKQRILVVDDNEDAAIMIAMLMGRLGHEVQVAHNGMQALEIGARLEPDLVLMDLSMPVMDGYAACKRTKDTRWGRAAYVVALSGLGQEEDRRKSKEAGFDHHLVKPVDLAALEKLLEGRPADLL